jgi:putative membrane protein
LLAVAGRRDVEEAVSTAARSAFVELAVSHTRDRSGVLVYVSLLERRIRVIADVGVKTSMPLAEWKSAAAALEGILQQHDDDAAALEALAEAVESLGPTLAPHLPRRPDDTNELEDVAW